MQLKQADMLLAPATDEYQPAAQATGAAPPEHHQPAGHTTLLFVALPLQKMPAEHVAGA